LNANVRGANAYRRVEAQSRSPLELVVMLYDGVLSSLSEATAAAARGDVATRAAAVSKSLTIIGALQTTLNVSEGGAVAVELDRIYTYASQRLIDVTTKKDYSALTEVHKLLTTIREAWEQIAKEQVA
jgi:flagellar secretion chaperone FliS